MSSNNASRSTQWAEEPWRPDGPICGVQCDHWPFKICNLAPKHDGDHCNRIQAGTKMVEFWFALQSNQGD